MPSERLRILGGVWKNRLLTLPKEAKFRPTTELARERLFNWLDNVYARPGEVASDDDIVSADQNRLAWDQVRVLDLFAGSGMLSLEALSRGAKEACLVDLDRLVVANLRKLISHLALEDRMQAILAKMPSRWARLPAHPFELILVDPPFRFGLVAPVLARLIGSSQLTRRTMVYVECELSLQIDLGDNWQAVQTSEQGGVKQLILTPNLLD